MIPRIPVVRALILGLALVLAALPCTAEGLMFYEQRQPAGPPLPELAAQSHQVVIDLTGAWEYRLDDAKSYTPGWVPGCFRGAEGILSMRRTFSIPDSERGWQYQLFLPEIHYAVEVWINGNFISAFTGSHLGFSCDIARNQLRPGAANEIELRVDNRLTPRTTLPVRAQVLHPANFGGPFGGVYLRGVPAWSVDDVGIVPAVPIDPQAVRASVRVQIGQRAPLDQDRDVRLRVVLRDSTGSLVAEASSDPLARGSAESLQTTVALPRFAVALWSPERPVLYRLTGELIAGADTLHRLTRVVGFKNVEIRGGGLYLNGAPLQVRGIDYLPEDPTSGRAISAEQIRQDLTQIRELGMNVVRVPFAPPPPNLARVADELGLLLLVETDLYWIPGEILSRPAYQTLVRQTFDQIVATLHDHVSILAWGLGSQLNWREPVTQQFSRNLYESLRQLDGRPCYIETTEPGMAEGLADLVFVTLPAGGGNAATTLAQNSRLPVIVSRVGRLAAQSNAEGGASAGIVNQAEFVAREVQTLKSSNVVDGYIVHAFADYHGSTPLLAQPDQQDPLLYSFGLLGFDRHERLAYCKLLDLARTGQTTPPVPTGSSENNPAAFPVIGLAALVLLSVELRRNNVFRQNLKRVFLHAHGFYSDLRYRRFLHTAQPMLLGLLEALTLSILLASVLYSLRSSFALDYYLTHFLPWAATKAWLVNLIWAPVRLTVYFTGIFLLLIITQMVMVRVTGIFFRERVDFWQSANYVIWAFAGLLYLLPLAVIFYRILEMPKLAPLAILAVVGGLVWSFIRLLGALRTGFGGSPLRVYAAVLGIGVLISVVAIVLLENRLGTLTYLQFFQTVFAAR